MDQSKIALIFAGIMFTIAVYRYRLSACNI